MWVLALLNMLSRIMPILDPAVLRLCDTSKRFQQKLGLKPENVAPVVRMCAVPSWDWGTCSSRKAKEAPIPHPSTLLGTRGPAVAKKGVRYKHPSISTLLRVFWSQCELCMWNRKGLELANISIVPCAVCFISEHLQFHLQIWVAFWHRYFLRSHSECEPALHCWMEEVTFAIWTQRRSTFKTNTCSAACLSLRWLWEVAIYTLASLDNFRMNVLSFSMNFFTFFLSVSHSPCKVNEENEITQCWTIMFFFSPWNHFMDDNIFLKL